MLRHNVSWESFPNDLLTNIVGNLADNSLFTDVTLVCDDQIGFEAHKIILSSCSEIFRNLLMISNDPNPTIFLPGVTQRQLQALPDPIEENQIMEVWSHLVQVKSNEDNETFPIKKCEIKTELVNEETSIVNETNEEFTGINQNKSVGPDIDQMHAKKDKAIKRKRSVSVLCTQ